MTWLTLGLIVFLGLVALAVLVVQILIGLRKIKFKGKLHLKVHRWTAYVLLAVAVLHGLAALVLFDYI